MLQQERKTQLLWGKTLILGMIIALSGILLASSNLGHWLEEEVGLPWLFQLRGSLAPPNNVVVVNIDYVSSQRLGLSNNPSQWPRSMHADLVHKLSKHGASVIVFDVFFEKNRDSQDNSLFASAMREAGNVILFQALHKQPINNPFADRQKQHTGYIESLKHPIPILKDAALGLAPFPLPKVPAQVNHFIMFKPQQGDLPTLPVVALQTYAITEYTILRKLLIDVLPQQISQLPTNKTQLLQLGGIQKLSQSLRKLFLRYPGLAQQLISRLEHLRPEISAHQYVLLSRIINSYEQPHSLYLNFYGPPQTITTIPYYKVLESTDQGDPLKFAGKTVFVGFSEQFQPQQKDGFYTVFSQAQSGLDLSGVEIAATAFANLLHGHTLIPSSAPIDMLVYFTWAALLSLVFRKLSAALLFPVALLLVMAYHQISYTLFSQTEYWIPLLIPLFWQAPLALIGALLLNYFDVQQQRRNIRHAFGQHLPIEVVDQLAKGFEYPAYSEEQSQGVVLATDAQQYTNLSEKLNPVELRDLINQYYVALFSPICAAGGVVSDVVGDAALAIWTSSTQPDQQQRQQACHAALGILSAVESFNRENPAYQLPTRLGLHFGDLVMGHVGAMNHYEYRAVGDTINTASRIEGFNKQLGTRILVSYEVLQGLEGFITRDLGNFLLPGKSNPLNLFELKSTKDQYSSTNPYTDFLASIDAFQAQRWTTAAKGFEDFILKHGDDGPSLFYLNLCKQYINQPPTEWDGFIRVIHK